MKSNGRILVMDDQANWQQEVSNVLRRDGYAVDAVATVSDAIRHIQESLYHLLVLDIRMIHPDTTNVEGMEFLNKLEELELLDAIQIIMLSAFGTPEQMRKAFRKYRVADFQSKANFSGLSFVESVNQIFVESVRWNGNLEIIWNGIEGAAQAVNNIVIEGKRIKRNTSLQDRIAFDLDDLLRRLFYKADSILIKPMAPGNSGTGVLRVEPFYAAGKGESVVVKFGHFPIIDEEYANYKRYVEPFIGGARHTSVIERRRTPYLGGIIYSLLGAAGGEVSSLGSYYLRSELPEIVQVLKEIFFVTCANWYINRSTLRLLDLTAEYEKLLRFSTENLNQARQERPTSVQGTDRLTFPALKQERTFLNPITATAGQRFLRPTYTCVTHGDLNDANVLVDTDGHIWLIDFFRTGEGHILRDIAELEAVLRLQFLAPDEATLDERLAMEEALLTCDRFSQVERLLSNFPTENQALKKIFDTCVHLRMIAQKIMAQNREDDISEYYVAIMYFALNTIRFYSLPKIQREHALLSASLLAERLGLDAKHG